MQVPVKMNSPNKVLVVGLTMAKILRVLEAKVKADPQIVINQVLAEYEAKSKKLKKGLQLVLGKKDCFSYFNILQVSRVENWAMNKLAWLLQRWKN